MDESVPETPLERIRCEPCSEDGKTEAASMFCSQCKEFLCDICMNMHKTQKATKSHTIVSSDEVKDSDVQDDDAAKEQCEPCNEAGRITNAKHFCKQCDEKLCDDCANAHARQKLTKSHTLVDIKDIKSPEKNCDPCCEDNVCRKATKYCNICEEYLCDRCIRIHQTQKATKGHQLINVEDLASEEARMCEPCLGSGKRVSAVVVCIQCHECICEQCSNRHKTQKASKNHQTISIKKLPRPKPKECGECAEKNRAKTARGFCKDCNEDLCEECVATHRLFRYTKEHEITDIADQLSQLIRNIKLCDPCSETDTMEFAIKMCRDCKENYCEDCCKFHSRHKATKTHQLLDCIEEVGEQVFCDPCKEDETKVKAESFCKECEEYLCNNCCKFHKSQKLTRKHELISATEHSSMENPEMVVCEICKEQNEVVKATSYCLDCEDPELLCDSCTKQHSKQKRFQLHKISKDISNFVDKKSIDREAKLTHSRDDEADRPKEPPVAARPKEPPVAARPKEPPVAVTKTNIKPADLPGQPSASDVKADSITLRWEKPEQNLDGDVYQIRYKDVDKEGTRWTFHPSQPQTASITLCDMKANTKYVFQVRVVHEDGEGPYGPQSEPITTPLSPAARVVEFSKKVKHGEPSPSLFALPVTENRNARNFKAKTKKFDVGAPPVYDAGERIIMLVGATGTGKSTLVDGIVNYVLGVNWNDSFRFTVINMEEEEKAREKNQALSQTEWITCYTLNPERGSRLEYRLTIIDTPGFGDTRGLQRDQGIVDQIRELFSEMGQKGVACLDAVCFLIKAPDARLTATQNYIFHSIMSLFGNDIEKNICTLVTFADGMEPPVLASLRQSNLPFGKHFTFNNSGLFTKNVDLDNSSMSPMFWDMGCKSFRAFFDHLGTMKTKSLQLTKEVLDERLKLEVTVQSLQPQIAAGLSKIDELKGERRVIEQHRTDIEANKNFEYEVTETRQTKTELAKGVHVTNCLHCNITCHKNCAYANDSDKAKCSSMDSEGNCTVCSDHCRWDMHHNTPYIFGYESVTVKKTYAEKLQKYKKAGEKVLSHQQVIERMAEELWELEDTIGGLVKTVSDCNARLKEIALRPNPLSMVDHIDTMIQAETLEQKEGYKARIEVLKEFRKKAEIGKDIARFNEEATKTIKEVHAVAGSAKTQKKSSIWPWSKYF